MIEPSGHSTPDHSHVLQQEHQSLSVTPRSDDNVSIGGGNSIDEEAFDDGHQDKQEVTSTGMKSESKSSGGKGQDSPAFRLRPRRSTPKASPFLSSATSTSSGHKRAFHTIIPGSVLESVAGVSSSYTTVESVKRKLFKILSKNAEDEAKQAAAKEAARLRPPSPMSSVKTEVNLAVFVERINVEELTPNTKYPLNYVCLKVVNIINKNLCQENRSSTYLSDCKPILNDENQSKLLVIDAQEPDGHKPTTIRVEFHDEYASKLCSSLSVGNVIEVTKFETFKCEPQADHQSSDIADHTEQTLPFYLVVKPSVGDNWIPIISIKSAYNSINNPLLLTVDTSNKKSDAPSPGLRFTSYVIKRRSVSLDGDRSLAKCTPGRRISPRTSSSSTLNPVCEVTRRSRRSSSSYKTTPPTIITVSPSSSTASSSSSTSTIITSFSHGHLSPSPTAVTTETSSVAKKRMNAIDFSTKSKERVSKNSRRVSLSLT